MPRRLQLGFDARPLWAPLAIAAVVASIGCQSFAPTSGLTAKHHEQKIVKQAANDPFPSPSDVGLSKETEKL